jgi:hypothetical protein
MPRKEKMPGIQSTKLTWKSEAFLADFEKVAASIRVKRAMENYQKAGVSGMVVLQLLHSMCSGIVLLLLIEAEGYGLTKAPAR